MNQNPLVSRPLPVLFAQFVGPAMVAMVLDGIQGMVDGLFLGRYAGPDAMASVNIANPFFQLIIGATMILCTGTMSAAGRALGAQDFSRAKNLYRSALVVLLSLTGLILAAGLLFARPIALFLGANAVLLPGAARYVRVIACFAPVIAFKIFFGFRGGWRAGPGCIWPAPSPPCAPTSCWTGWRWGCWGWGSPAPSPPPAWPIWPGCWWPRRPCSTGPAPQRL